MSASALEKSVECSKLGNLDQNISSPWAIGDEVESVNLVR